MLAVGVPHVGLNTGMLSSAAGTAAVQELRIACTVAQQEREGGTEGGSGDGGSSLGGGDAVAGISPKSQ